MCRRFIEPDLIGTDHEHSETKINPFPGQPVIIPPRGPRRYNVAPTQDILIFGGSPLVAMDARWWLIPSWRKGNMKDWKATTFNARIEDAKEKPSFRAVWRHGRCLIPMGGYYEWTGKKSHKQPHVILSGGVGVTVERSADLHDDDPRGQCRRWQHSSWYAYTPQY